MRCEYIVTYQDFLESMKAYRKVLKQAAIGYWLYVWIIPAACLAIGIILLFAYFKQDDDISGALYWVLGIGLGIAFGLPIRYRMSLQRAFKQRAVLAKDKPMFFEFDDATARFIVPDGAEITYPWGSFTNYFENDRVAVLFIQEAVFHTIPKRAMDEDGWKNLRQLVNLSARKI